MNPLARISNFNAAADAAHADWKTRQGSALAWPKADQLALVAVAVVLALMLCAYALPESEATVYLRTQVAVWGNLALFASAGILAVCAMVWNAGKGLKIEFGPAPDAALPEGEGRQAIEQGEWTHVGRVSPLLQPDEERAILSPSNPPLNLATAQKIKSCMVAGMTPEEIRAALNFSDVRHVYRYTSRLKDPQKYIGAASPIDIEI